MDFSVALRAIKDGHRVARSGWNGKGMFVFLVHGGGLSAGVLRPGSPYKVMADEMGMGEGDAFTINGHIDMRAADGSMVVGWLASQTDLLADDWEIVGISREIAPPCDVEISADAEPRPTFTDVTHSVFREGEAVYSGTKDECQTFADNHFPSGGYGIGPIQG